MHVVKGQSTNWKSLKIQNFLRPGNQILAQKTMLWVFVCRTLTWCSQILKMWSIHTGEQINNSKNPNRQRLRYIRTTTYHCCHSLHAFTWSCEKFSFLRYDSWPRPALPWKYEPGQNRIRMFFKTPEPWAVLKTCGFRGSSACGPPSISRLYFILNERQHFLFTISLSGSAL